MPNEQNANQQNAQNAYEHTGEVTGFGSGPQANAAAEHRDTTFNSAETRNEIPPEGREQPDRYGPRTHQDTKIDEPFRGTEDSDQV